MSGLSLTSKYLLLRMEPARLAYVLHLFIVRLALSLFVVPLSLSVKTASLI